jgi:hypothetical protein
MTTPDQGLGCDPVHPAVGSVQSWLSLGHHQGAQGELLVLTVRVPNATVTSLLSKADAQTWINLLQTEVDKMSSLVLAPPGTVLPPLNGKEHP